MFLRFYLLVLAVLGLLAAHEVSLVVASRGCSLAAVHRLLLAVASLVVEQGLWVHGLSSCGMWALEHQLSSCGAWS